MRGNVRDPRELKLEVDAIAGEVVQARLQRAAKRISTGSATLADLRTWTPTWAYEGLLRTCQEGLPLHLITPNARTYEQLTTSDRALSVLYVPPGDPLPEIAAEALEAYGPEARYTDRDWNIPVLIGDDNGMTVRRVNFRGQRLEDGISDRALAAAASGVVPSKIFQDKPGASVFEVMGRSYLRLLNVDWTEKEAAVVEQSSPWAVLALSWLELAVFCESFLSDLGVYVGWDPHWLGEDARTRYLGQIRSNLVTDIDLNQPTTRLVLDMVASRARRRVARHIHQER